MYFLRFTFEGPDMIIANVQPGDEGVYTCQVITNLDTAEAINTLTICGKITDQKPKRVWVYRPRQYMQNCDLCNFKNPFCLNLQCVDILGVMILLLSPSDRPDPPVLLQITDSKHRAVTLSWTPGEDHNSPVLGLVQTHTHLHTPASIFLVFLCSAKTASSWNDRYLGFKYLCINSPAMVLTFTSASEWGYVQTQAHTHMYI